MEFELPVKQDYLGGYKKSLAVLLLFIETSFACSCILCSNVAFHHSDAKRGLQQAEVLSSQSDFRPVVTAVTLYGQEWKGKSVLFIVDNQSVINSIYSKEGHLIYLIKLLVFLQSTIILGFTQTHTRKT